MNVGLQERLSELAAQPDEKAPRLRPRGEWVVVHRIRKGETAAGLVVAANADDAWDFYAHAVGPDVEGVEPGDRVVVQGGARAQPIESLQTYALVEQEHILAVWQRGEPD